MKENVLFWVGVKSKDPLLIEKHGNFKYLEISKKTWKWWCSRNNVLFYEYKQSSEKDTEAHRPTWTRWFDVFDMLDAENINYNKIAVVDGSSLCRWDTPNFFNLVGDNLTAFRSLENVKWIHQGIQGYQDLFPEVAFDISKYISCGFQIFDKSHRSFLDKLKFFYYSNYKTIIKKQKEQVRKGTDQPVYNYMLQQEDIKIDLTLSPAFMLTHLSRFDWLGTNWQLKEDNTPFFIKYGYIWFYSGFPNRGDREIMMKQTWELIKHNYE